MPRNKFPKGFVRFAAVIIFSAACVTPLAAQEKSTGPVMYVICGTVLEGKSLAPRKNAVIEIRDGRIQSVRDASPGLLKKQGSGFTVFEFPAATCLPGLIDTHTHVLLQGDITEEEYDEQLLKWPLPYRTIRATQSARKALEYGFTTIRDVETEGAGYADVSIRDAINQGIIPGPRMQVATRALDVTGAYPLQGFAPEVPVPHGVQLVNGPDEARKAVREQISHGADWIKVYADRSYFLRPDGVLDDIPTFTAEELHAIVDEAHRDHHKVAAHAAALNGVHNAVEAGVDSIEHGMYISDADMQKMIDRGIFYVPTLYVGEYVAEGRAKEGRHIWLDMVSIHAATFRKAVERGVKIAFGTDVGGFDWNINPAVEFPLMVKYGMTPAQAVRAATVLAAELLGMEDQVGAIEPGKLADIVAVPGDPLADVSVLEHVQFVMKGGEIFKNAQ
jgi:imidazolonepropionase-like amidohydrolase